MTTTNETDGRLVDAKAQAGRARLMEIEQELDAKRFAKRFVYGRLRELGKIRLGLLQEILSDAGGIPMYALPAAKSLGCDVERLPEYGDAEFVFAPRGEAWGEEGAA
jgi:hypothetical protein